MSVRTMPMTPEKKPKRRNKVSGSAKQRDAVKALATGEADSLSEAMRLAKYSETTIDHPGENFAGAPGVIAAAEEFGVTLSKYVTNHHIAKKIKEFTEAQKYTNSYTEPDRLVPDYQTQVKGVELAMKVYRIGQGADTINNTQINIGELKGKYSKA